MLCERCGSINIIRSRSSAVDKVVRFFTGRKRVTCQRCLWTGRIEWTHDDDFVPRIAELRPVGMEKSLKTPKRGSDDFDIDQFD
jgi:hypothetical protein